MALKSLFLVILLIGMILIAGCASRSASIPERTPYPNALCSPTDYDNGVYYFPCSQRTFGYAISAWKKDNPDKIILAITSDNTLTYGSTGGYFVVTGIK